MTDRKTSLLARHAIPMGTEGITKVDNCGISPAACVPKPPGPKARPTLRLIRSRISPPKRFLILLATPIVNTFRRWPWPHTSGAWIADATALPELITRTFNHPRRTISNALEIRRKSGEALSGGSLRPEMGTPFEETL